MVRINSITGVNNFKQRNVAFKGSEAQTNPQIEQLNATRNDFAVKTPIAYSKTGEVNLPYDTKAYCYKLANGQRIVIVPMEGETVLRTYVNTGSMNETDKIRGISHYIEHNLFNGSEGLEEGDFFKQVNKMGAYTNASTGFGETNYIISSNLLNEGDLEKKVKLHASMLETPLFAMDKLEKEKDIVNSEINMITSDPYNLAVNTMLKNLYGIKTNSIDMIGGTTDNITNLTREDVVNYYNNNYYPANMVTVITGEVEPENVMKLISKNFTSKKQPYQSRHFEKFTPIQHAIREDIISDKTKSSVIVIGFDGPSSDNTKDRVLTEAVNVLLSLAPSSRFNTKLRKLNASASLYDEKISSNPKDGRALIVTADSTEENSEKTLKTIFNEIGNLKNNPPTPQEMKIIKKMMLKSFASTIESPYRLNNSIGTLLLENNEKCLNDYEKIVNEMSSEDIVKAAEKYFDVNKASVTVVHPSSATKETIANNHKDAISFTGSKKEVINLSKVKEYDTINNYRVITLDNKTNNIEMLYKITTDDRPNAKVSAKLVLSKLLNRGSAFKTESQMDSDLAQDGIMRGFSANSQGVVCSLGFDTDSINKAFATLQETINNPRFTQEEFELAKSLVIDSIKTSEKSAFDKLDSEIYKDLPSGVSNEELLKDLETLTIDDVRSLYEQFMKKGKGIISISGPFERKTELKNIVFNNIAKFNPVQKFDLHKPLEDFKPIETTKVLTDTDFKSQAEIVQAYKFKINNNLKDTAAIFLLNEILGGSSSSRLFRDLREQEKLCYHVKSKYSITDDIGVLSLKIGTTTDNKETGEIHFDNVKKSIDGFNKHVNKMKSERVTDEELSNAKLTLKNNLFSNHQSAYDKIDTLINTVDTPYGVNKENSLIEEIDNITAEDIQNAANYIFSTKPTYSILATADTLKANEEYLNNLSKNEL